MTLIRLRFFTATLFSLTMTGAFAERGEILDRHGVVLATNDADGDRIYPFGAAAVQLLGTPRAGGIERELGEKLAKGETVRLTLDIRAQLAAELAMRHVGRGAAVVTTPATGEILALVSVPSYDPALFEPKITREDFDRLQRHPGKPLFNRAVAGSYPPASTFKVITALAQSERGVAAYDCQGVHLIGDRRFHCWRRGGHAHVDLQTALTNSCNVYFYRHAEAVGAGEILRIARLLGVGQPLRIPLPFVSDGHLPDLAEHEKKYGQAWGEGDTANLAIGHGVLQVSPLQVAGYVGAIGNGGDYVEPHLIRGAEVAKRRLTHRGVSAKRIALVRRGMWDVVNSRSGTAREAYLKEVEIAGKTGTGIWNRQKEKLGWFAGYSPKHNPKYAISVVVENVSSAGRVAAPLAAMILADCANLKPNPAPEGIRVKRLEPADGPSGLIEKIELD